MRKGPGKTSTLWVLVLVGGLLAWLPVCRLNVSPSLPLGLYYMHPVRLPLVRGTIVLLPVPRVVRPWHRLPLLKPVAGGAGDEACITDQVWVGGRPYGTVLTEAHGYSLPRLRGCFTVQPGEVFLASDAPRSLDSRYFGAVPISALTAQASPVLTWR